MARRPRLGSDRWSDLLGLVVAALLSGLPGSRLRAADPDEVVVTGFRASLQTAQAIKERAGQIVESIAAEDIVKLPDANVAEALQRVSGVQVTRDLGDGSAISVRGLVQVETTVNGREVFTAAGGRTLNFEDIPSELLAGVDVYKTQSADLIEGGIGGSIDIRTHRPFDFKGLEVGASALANYGSLAGKAGPAASGLVSDRWMISGSEVGALLGVTYQDRTLQEDYISAGGPFTQTYGGQKMVLPAGNYDLTYTGDRQRWGLNAALQWRPLPDLELYAEGIYARFETRQKDYGNTLGSPASLKPIGSIEAEPAGNNLIFQSGSFANASLTTFGIYRDVIDVNQQYAIGEIWTHGPLTVTSDLSYSPSSEDLYYTELDAHTTVPAWTSSVQGAVPSSIVGGIDASNPQNYTAAGLSYSVNHWDGGEKTFRLDADYRFDSGLIDAADTGLRYADSRMAFSPIRYASNVTIGSIANDPGLFLPTPKPSMFTAGRIGSTPELRDFPVANPDSLKDISALFTAVGKGGTSLAVAPLSTFNIDETTETIYAMAKFKAVLALPIDGNVGVRVIRSDDDLSGNAGISNASYTGIERSHRYLNALPSANIRVHLDDENHLYLRAAYSDSLTRPDFSSLSPTATLLPGNSTGTQGNPNLNPFKSENIDLSLEWYASKAESISLGVFHKTVDGFLLTEGQYENINGQTYLISQPVNSGRGVVKGAEISGQRFFDFFPGPLTNTGIQVNVTRALSKVPTSIGGVSAPLSNLSKTSYNLTLFYDDDAVSARLAYNWRSSFLSGINILSGVGIEQVYTASYGWLDGSVTYKLTDQIALTLEGTNLLGTLRAGYYQIPGGGSLPSFRAIDDRQVIAGFRLKL